MLFDWFTVVAQALNFLILVWLLKRFLYKPILHAIDEREKRIATELANADARKAEAQKERDEFQHKNEEFDQQRAALLSKAQDDAQAERLRLLDEARKAADALSAKREETLKSDAHNLNQAISRRAQQEVFAIARKALSDLATTSLEERLGEVFTRRLRELDGQAKKGLAEALKTASDPALLRSAFDLPATQRAVIQNALNETFSAEIHLRFETTPDLISGIELSANGQKVAWSIADYLASLEKGVDELLKENDKAEAKPEPAVAAKPASEATVEAPPAATVEPSVAAKPTPEAKVEATPAAKVEPAVAAKSAPETKVEAAPAAKVEPAVAAKPAPEAKVEPPAAAKPAPQAKVEAAPAAKVEPAVAAKPAPKAKVETAPQKPKPETKSQ